MESGSVAIYAILFLISGVFLGCLLAWLLYRTNNGWICCRWFSTRGTNVDDSMLRVCDMKNRDQLSSSRNESQGYGRRFDDSIRLYSDDQCSKQIGQDALEFCAHVKHGGIVAGGCKIFEH
uniref:Transmembrane protein n=1 Tax=Romanomermis culicivorax TaxID=13658 RepID=A0A915JFN8_ROMCU